jgi:hypothetical protein
VNASCRDSGSCTDHATKAGVPQHGLTQRFASLGAGNMPLAEGSIVWLRCAPILRMSAKDNPLICPVPYTIPISGAPRPAAPYDG